MSDESTHGLLEPRVGEGIPTTIQTALSMDGQPITPPAQLMLSISTSPRVECRADDGPSRGRTASRLANPAQLANPRSSSCCGSSPLIKIVTVDELQQLTTKMFQPKIPEVAVAEIVTTVPSHQSSESISKFVKVVMSYNEWGELVDERNLHQPAKSEDLTVTQIIRSIKKSYHHDVGIFLDGFDLTNFFPPNFNRVVDVLGYR